MTEWFLGTKVRATPGGMRMWGGLEGKIGAVAKVNELFVYVDWPGFATGRRMPMKPHEIEVVEP